MQDVYRKQINPVNGENHLLETIWEDILKRNDKTSKLILNNIDHLFKLKYTLIYNNTSPSIYTLKFGIIFNNYIPELHTNPEEEMFPLYGASCHSHSKTSSLNIILEVERDSFPTITDCAFGFNTYTEIEGLSGRDGETLHNYFCGNHVINLLTFVNIAKKYKNLIENSDEFKDSSDSLTFHKKKLEVPKKCSYDKESNHIIFYSKRNKPIFAIPYESIKVMAHNIDLLNK